jgi:hypothetical protein
VEQERLRHGERTDDAGPPSAAENGRREDNVWSDRWSGPDRLTLEAQLRSTYGFLVDTTDGREVGIVDEVMLDDDARLVQLEVCGGWFGRRRRTVRVDDVVEIFPADRRLIVLRSVVDSQSR